MSTDALLPELAPLFESLISPDGPRQAAAEARLGSLFRQWPGEMMIVLAQVGAQGVGGFQPDARLLALILLNRMSFTELAGLHLNATDPRPTAPFDMVNEQKRVKVEKALCAGLSDEMDPKMRKGMGQSVAEWAKESARRQRPCIHMPPVLLQLVLSERPLHRLTAYQILALYPTLLGDSVADASFTADDLAHILRGGLYDTSVDVNLEAMKALRGAISAGWTIIRDNAIKTDLLQTAFKQLPRLSRHAIDTALEPLVDIAGENPSLLIPLIDDIVPHLLSLLAPPVYNMPSHRFSPYPLSGMKYTEWQCIANQAAEVILALVEACPEQFEPPTRITYIHSLVGSLIGHQISGLESEMDCREWLVSLNGLEDDMAYPAYSEEAFSRLSAALASPTLLLALSDHMRGLIKLDDWRARYCVLRALASIVEGSAEHVIEQLDQIHAHLYTLRTDVHPRVRYGWLELIPELARHLEGFFQKKYMLQTIEDCVGILADPTPRVKVMAVEALASLFRSEHSESLHAVNAEIIAILNKRLFESCAMSSDAMCGAMFRLFKNIAASTGGACKTMGNWWINSLLEVTSFADPGPSLDTRGAALETATSIGAAIGKQACLPIATRLAEVALATQNNIHDDDDVRIPYLRAAWFNLCVLLEEDFAPFVPYVIPPLLKTASDGFRQTDGAVYEDGTRGNSTEEWDDKAIALESLAGYTRLGALYAPYLEESMQIALDGLRPTYSVMVMESAAFMVPSLLDIAYKAERFNKASPEIQAVLSRIIDAVFHCSESSVTSMLYKAFSDSLRIVGSGPSAHVAKRFFSAASSQITKVSDERQSRQAEREKYTRDDERYAELEEEDEAMVLAEVAGALSTVASLDDDPEVQSTIRVISAELEAVQAMAVYDSNADGREGS